MAAKGSLSTLVKGFKIFAVILKSRISSEIKFFKLDGTGFSSIWLAAISWAFIIGVLLAILVGVFAANLQSETKGTLTLVLVVLGLVVGFLNVTEKETTPFLVAAAALMLTATSVSTLQSINLGVNLGMYLAGIVSQVAVFVAPAAVIVALKAINSLAKD